MYTDDYHKIVLLLAILVLLNIVQLLAPVIG